MDHPLKSALAPEVFDRELRRMADRFGFNSRTGVGGMLAAGKIGRAEAVAARRWLGDYVLAEHGAFDPGKPGGSSGQSATGISDAKLFAAIGRRKAKEKLGSVLDRLLIAALADGLTAQEMADVSGSERKHIGGMLTATLILLSEHYASEDCTTRRH